MLLSMITQNEKKYQKKSAAFCKLHRTCTEHARILHIIQSCLLSDSVEAEIAIEV